MSALFDHLEKQTRLLTAQEKAALARVLINELVPAAELQLEQLSFAEAQRHIRRLFSGRVGVSLWR
jgi:hypothetical protein